MKQIYLLFLSVLLLSCATNQQVQPQEVFSVVEDQNLQIEMIYIGSTPNYHIIETIIENKSGQTVNIDRKDFEMILIKKDRSLYPLSVSEAQLILKGEKKKLKKEKKNRLVWGIVAAGLTTALSAGAGISVAENILYTTENAFYILDDDRFMQRNIRSVEEEITYIQNMNMTQHAVRPYEVLQKDLLFPIERTRGDVEIIYRSDDTDYILQFKGKDFR